jgi:hypothetical protein
MLTKTVYREAFRSLSPEGRSQAMLDVIALEAAMISPSGSHVALARGGTILLNDYHRILIELNDYKIQLQEAIHNLRRQRADIRGA